MSAEKHKSDAILWYRQAQADLITARKSIDSQSFEWACFQSQQAAEKALKALWLYRGMDPWGHSVFNLINEIPGDDMIKKYSDDGLMLDKLYIPTRYPNGLPGLLPSEAYGKLDAENAIAAAERIVSEVSSFVGK